ncbi:histidine phosphatase family protein [Chloroflexota bacterium]
MTSQPEQILILIKHSLPEMRPELTASLWSLSDEGRQRCQRLAERLAPFNLDSLVSSEEPKAIETGRIIAELLGLPFATAPNLHEHLRLDVPFLGDRRLFQAQVAKVFEKPAELVFGSETGDEAGRRYSKALGGVLASHPEGNLGVVSHGTVMALYVSRACGLDATRFWIRLGLPSYVVLADGGTRLVKVVEEVSGP